MTGFRYEETINVIRGFYTGHMGLVRKKFLGWYKVDLAVTPAKSVWIREESMRVGKRIENKGV